MFNFITTDKKKHLIFLLIISILLSSYVIQAQDCKSQGNRSFNCIGSRCTKRCVTAMQCQSKGGLLSMPTSVCYFTECGMNQIYNISTQQCDCLNGFQRKAPKAPCNKIIQKCNGNGIKQPNGSCQCPDGFRTQNNFCHNCTFAIGEIPDFVKLQCYCNQPAFYKAENGSCVKSNCPGVLYYNFTLKTCMCRQGFIQVNNTFCQVKCGQKAYLTNGACRCVSNDLTYFPSKKSCMRLLTSCPTNFEQIDRNNNQCICRNGFQRNPINKMCQRKCGVNQFQTNNVCLCNPGYQRKSSNAPCTLIPKDCSRLSNEVLDVNNNQCICRNGFNRNNQGVCVQIIIPPVIPSCKLNQQFSSSLNTCICKSGYTRNSVSNLCQITQSQITLCPLNSKLVNNKCVCDLGFILQGQLCTSVCGLNQQFNSKTLSCDCIQGFGLINKLCTKCPSNVLNTVNNQCNCQFGLKWNVQTNVCEISCQANAVQKDYILANGQKVVICVCQSGFEQNSKRECIKRQDPVCQTCQTCPPQKICQTCPPEKICQTCPPEKVCQTCPTCQTCPPEKVCQTCPAQKTCPVCDNMNTCPTKSLWDSKKYRCVCSNPLQNLINGVCTTCPLNQIWSQNDNKCLCPSGFNIISDTCTKCPINSLYSIDRCICDIGYYNQNPLNLLNTVCKTCHSSCRSCVGPSNTECISCKNPQDTLLNGKCNTNKTPCPRGFYQNSQLVCIACGPYCKQCSNQLTCNSCVDGFNKQELDLFGSKTSFCAEICGDGKRFEYQCDDGNKQNNDGCSDTCVIQQGYTCIGGNITTASKCMKNQLVPSKKSQFKLTIPIRLSQQIVQVAKFQYLPSNISLNFCAQCKDLLLVTMLSYTTYPTINIDYIPSSLYSFTIRFKFNGIFSVPDFSYAVQINPKYNKYFSSEDMKKIQVTNVYAANYAIKDDTTQLQMNNSN